MDTYTGSRLTSGLSNARIVRVSVGWSSAVIYAGIIAACSEGGGGSSGSDASAPDANASTIPDDTLLSALSDDQARALCAEVDATLASSGAQEHGLEFTCRTSGREFARASHPATDAEARDDCQTAYDGCESSAQGAARHVHGDRRRVPRLRRTAGERFAALEEATSICAALTVSSLAQDPTYPAQPEAGVAFQKKCP